MDTASDAPRKFLIALVFGTLVTFLVALFFGAEQPPMTPLPFYRQVEEYNNKVHGSRDMKNEQPARQVIKDDQNSQRNSQRPDVDFASRGDDEEIRLHNTLKINVHPRETNKNEKGDGDNPQREKSVINEVKTIEQKQMTPIKRNLYANQRHFGKSLFQTNTTSYAKKQLSQHNVQSGKGGASPERARHFWRDTARKKTRYYIPVTDADFHQTPMLQKKPRNSLVTCPSNLTSSSARKLECRHRLPNVIGIGVAKCGTAAVSFLLSAHPQIVHAVDSMEVFFWNKYTYRGLGWYMRRMPVSSKYQLTMEKTPAYFLANEVPEEINRVMPSSTKFLVVVRDPAKRSVSLYVHLTQKLKIPEHFIDHPVNERHTTRCYLNNTFETSVIRPNGSLMDYNCLLASGVYSRGLQKWLDVFPRERFFVIDGDAFVENPLPILQEVETFLGLPKYFDESKIYFDETKGFYCRSGYKPKRSCLGNGKGRPHPDVDPAVMQRLKDFYHPHNLQFEELVGKKFSWT